jgi:isopentenyl-diphosphate delta-isomerase
MVALVQELGRSYSCSAVGPEGCVLEDPQALELGQALHMDLRTTPEHGLAVEATVAELWTEENRAFLRFDRVDREQLLPMLTGLRKDDHLDLARDRDVESDRVRTGLDLWRLPHNPLPELHADQVRLDVELFGRSLSSPILVSGMTGGSTRGGELNRRLAAFCQRHRLGMGLGSQRAMLEEPALARTFAVRELAPDILLIANLGAVSFNHGITVAQAVQLVEDTGADALALHLNALQEYIQAEGDRDFRNLWERIEELCASSPVPVLLKETGCGIPGNTAAQAVRRGVSGFDISGAGGTNWGHIEGLRRSDAAGVSLGQRFRNWGIPTDESILQCRAAAPDSVIIGSGGLRHGLQAAVALSLGADAVAMALPFLRAAEEGDQALDALHRQLTEELAGACFLTGSSSVADLRTIDPTPLDARGRALSFHRDPS